ncbi:hypothetical protein P029_02990 [Anaplasma phagocytophilum str. Norway variant2]|uniref:Uncharacterized protein n=2 Tax=Anaplasma phagocytophilum TaxID=948 RepID=A0A161I5X5_ANAPH|nr:hypothetical protein P029_02990 [Anaplasma phagocytophilum str. Norway variant2]
MSTYNRASLYRKNMLENSKKLSKERENNNLFYLVDRNRARIDTSLMHASSLAHLTSMVMWCIVYAIALVALSQEKSLACEARKCLILFTMGLVILGYGIYALRLGLAATKSQQEEHEKPHAIAVAEKVELVTRVLEAAIFTILTCVSMALLVQGKSTPSCLTFFGMIASLLSIAASTAGIYRLNKLPETERPNHYRALIALRLLSIALGASSICLGAVCMAPSIQMSEGVQTSLRLMISFGWILAIAGAMIVAYASSKSVQHSNPDINASLSPSSNRDASVGLCVEDCIPTFQNNGISVAH